MKMTIPPKVQGALNDASNGNRVSLVISSDLKKPVSLPNLKKWKVHESDTVIHGTYSCRLKAKGFFLEHISTVAFRYMTVTSKGILMIYEMEDKGYVLNLRQAKSVTTETLTRLKDKIPQKICELKIKFKFGNVSLYLINNEIPKWRIVVGDFHDGQICNNCIITKAVKDNLKSCKEIQTDESSLSISQVETSEASIQAVEEAKPDVSVMVDPCDSDEILSTSVLSSSAHDSPSHTSCTDTASNTDSCITTVPMHIKVNAKNLNHSLSQLGCFIAPKPPMPNPINKFGALPGFTVRQRCRTTRIFGMTPSHVTSSSKEFSQKEPSVRCGSQSVASIRRVLEEKVSKRLQQIQQENEVLHHDKSIPELPLSPPPAVHESPVNFRMKLPSA